MAIQAPPRSRGAVALTLDPVALGDFLAERWDREPLLLQRDEPGRFDGVLSAADAERMACATGVRVPAFRLVRDGAQVPPSTYTKDVPWRPGSFSGLADVPRVAAEFAAGATLVLQGLHLHWHPAAVYCRELEMALGCPVQANAYWTPSSAQGFAVHHDTHDVFVLQVAGRKRWRVYPPVLERPLPAQKWNAAMREGLEAPVVDVELAAGDTLYLPRGWPHEAETSAEHSLHVTVGLHPPTRLDALRAALDACAAEDAELRRALGPDGEIPPRLVDAVMRRLAPEEVAARARRRFVDTRRPIQPDQLSQLATEIAPETLLRRRETVIADLDGDGTLRFEGRTIRFPPQARDALEWIHEREAEFTALEIPTRLDVPGRLVLIRRLVREGYLRAASPWPA